MLHRMESTDGDMISCVQLKNCARCHFVDNFSLNTRVIHLIILAKGLNEEGDLAQDRCNEGWQYIKNNKFNAVCTKRQYDYSVDLGAWGGKAVNDGEDG
jgi:hypothetical protein